MADQLKDKVIVITGSTRGFGYVAARELLKAGASVVISGRSQDTLDQAVKSLSGFGNVVGWTCDVRTEDQVYELARRTIGKFGRIDVWINNAAIYPQKILMKFRNG